MKLRGACRPTQSVDIGEDTPLHETVTRLSGESEDDDTLKVAADALALPARQAKMSTRSVTTLRMRHVPPMAGC